MPTTICKTCHTKLFLVYVDYDINRNNEYLGTKVGFKRESQTQCVYKNSLPDYTNCPDGEASVLDAIRTNSLQYR